MTDPLLWLNGDPTEGRRARVPEPSADPARTSPPPPPGAPAAVSGRRSGTFRAALAGGLVSAVLVGGRARGLGLVDTGGASAPVAAAVPPAPASTSVGAVKQGDVAAIYEAASPGVVSVRTGSGSGTGFVVDRDGTL